MHIIDICLLYTSNDICQEMSACFTDLLGSGQATFLAGDAESLPFPKGQDLIVSCSALQWFVSPALFFERCNTCLLYTSRTSQP